MIAAPNRDESGFTLIELLVVIVILPLIIGGIGAAMITTFKDQTGVSTRLSDSHDAQITSAYFVRDVQSSWRITTNTSPLCGSGIQYLGLQQFNTTGGATNVSFVNTTVGGAPALVRNFCATGAPTTTAVMAHGLGTGATVTLTCPSDPSCTADAGETAIGSSNVATVTMKVTELSSFQYSLSASPRVPLSPGGALPPGSPGPSFLLLGTGPTDVSCSGSGQTLTVNGVAADDAASTGSMSFGGGDSLVAQQVYSGSSSPVTGTYNPTSSQPYATGPAIPDPEANLPDPPTTGTVQSATASLPGPGVYINAVSITTPQTITSGIYIFEQGFSMTGNGGVSDSGSGVLFFIGIPNAAPSAPQPATYTAAGNGVLSLTGMTSGTYQGIVLFQARTDSNPLTIAGNGTTRTYGGMIYAPDAAVNTSGNGISLVGGVVAKQLNCGGNATVTIGPSAPVATTTTSLTSSPSSPLSGQPTTFTATIAWPTGFPAPAGPPWGGSVTFTETPQGSITPVTMCSAVALSSTQTATCTTPSLPAAGSPYTIKGIYSGNSSYSSSTGTMSQPVSPGLTSTSVSSSVNPSVPTQQVTYTAAVTVISPASGTPTGSVKFFDAGLAIGGCTAQPVNGSAQATCAQTYASPGSHTITAQYLGDGTFSGSASTAISQTVGTGSTKTALSSSLNPTVSSKQVTYTAAVTVVAPATGTPTGNVGFFDGGLAIGACTAVPVNGSAQAICAQVYATPGVHSITAQYLGDATLSASPISAALTEIVNLLTITETGSGNKDILSGTTNENTGTITVKIYLGTTATGAVLKTYVVSAFGGSSPSFTWTVTTQPSDLTAGTQYTAQAVQVDGFGNTSTSATTFVSN